jgi:hypothetical protein
MGFRRSLVRIQSPRHDKVRRDFKFWRTFSIRLEKAWDEVQKRTPALL